MAAPGLIANDYDPDGDPFLLSNFSPPANGALTSVVTDGSFTYVPNPGFTGTDSFTYVLREQGVEVFSAPVTVTIEVTPDPNRAPVGVADFYGTQQGATLAIPAPGLIANDYDPDGDPFLLSNFSSPTNGALTSVVTDGSFTYVPNPGFTGTDSFTYVLREQGAEVFSAPVTVTIFVGMPPSLDETCPSDLVISDFRTAPNAQEFVDLTNVGAETIDFSKVDCTLGAFTSASYVGLPATGMLAPGETLRFGASGAGADIGFPDGTLRDGYSGLALLDRADLPNGTAISTVQPDIVTSLVYLSGGTVYGFFHVDEANGQLYCDLYAGELHPYGQSQCTAVTARGADDATSNAKGSVESLDFTAMVEAAGAEQARSGTEASVPTAFALSAAYPNPLRERTTLEVAAPEAADVRVVVYDVLGREVAVLMDETVDGGRYDVAFDASGLASGTYVARMTAGTFAQTQRLTVVR